MITLDTFSRDLSHLWRSKIQEAIPEQYEMEETQSQIAKSIIHFLHASQKQFVIMFTQLMCLQETDLTADSEEFRQPWEHQYEPHDIKYFTSDRITDIFAIYTSTGIHQLLQ